MDGPPMFSRVITRAMRAGCGSDIETEAGRYLT
jgi:hypothetical protein